jgi:hypothetical protein
MKKKENKKEKYDYFEMGRQPPIWPSFSFDPRSPNLHAPGADMWAPPVCPSHSPLPLSRGTHCQPHLCFTARSLVFPCATSTWGHAVIAQLRAIVARFNHLRRARRRNRTPWPRSRADSRDHKGRARAPSTASSSFTPPPTRLSPIAADRTQSPLSPIGEERGIELRRGSASKKKLAGAPP